MKRKLSITCLGVMGPVKVRTNQTWSLILNVTISISMPHTIYVLPTDNGHLSSCIFLTSYSKFDNISNPTCFKAD